MTLVVQSAPLADAQHERFAQLMAEGKRSQGQAYLEAGYQCSSMNAACMGASRLIRNVKVQARIAYLQEQAATLATLDTSYVLSSLMRNAETAYEERDLSASNRALELLGKHLRLWEEPQQAVMSVAQVQLGDEERARLLTAILNARVLESV